MLERPRGDGQNMIVDIRRMALVTGLPNANEDYQVMQEALDNLNLTIGDPPDSGAHEDLILVQRRPRVIDLDKVEVIEAIGDMKTALITSSRTNKIAMPIEFVLQIIRKRFSDISDVRGSILNLDKHTHGIILSANTTPQRKDARKELQ